MTTDAQFREQVRKDAIGCGWPADVAAALARHAGRDAMKRPAAPNRHVAKGKAPRATAGTSLSEAVRIVGLPAAVACEFRAVGIVTTDRATPLLRDYIRASARNPASAATALRMHLLARATYHRKATAS